MLLGELYWRFVFGPYQKCLSGEKCAKSLKDHEGECGNHAGGWSTALKVLGLEYYWLTIYKDVVEICSNTFEGVELFMWPFKTWGMIIVLGILP